MSTFVLSSLAMRSMPKDYPALDNPLLYVYNQNLARVFGVTDKVSEWCKITHCFHRWEHHWSCEKGGLRRNWNWNRVCVSRLFPSLAELPFWLFWRVLHLSSEAFNSADQNGHQRNSWRPVDGCKYSLLKLFRQQLLARIKPWRTVY